MDASRGNEGGTRDLQPRCTYVNDTLLPLQPLHNHFHDERLTEDRGVELLDVLSTRKRVCGARPGGIRFLETAVTPSGPTRAGASYAPERLYFAFTRFAAVRRRRRHRLLRFSFLLPQEQRRDADIDTDVTARADIDSDSDAS